MRGIVLDFSKTVYWPVPKNACTTLKVHLINLLKIPNKGNPHTAEFKYTNESIPGYRDWALVRNPYDRFYSLWVNKIAPGHPEHYSFKRGLDMKVFSALGSLKHLVKSGMPFDEFADFILDRCTPVNVHWLPQSDQIPEGCEFQKMENLSTFFRAMFPSHNRGHLTKAWESAYTPGLRKLAYNYYQKDFERFGYDR